MARRSLIGLEIAGYRIVEYLNQGGMASLWRAEHPEIGASVAVKVMAPELATEPGLVSRFVDEAKIQVKLRHPNIVRVENFSSEHFAILMELVEGKPLDEVIGRDCGPIPLARAMPLVRQILAAVEYAHGMGVVHRDLKPANILITVDGTAKVTDFGIAKLLGQSHKTRTGTSMGTPAYMAPEQIRGAKEADERADIYALGITIYEMLAGRTPFEEERATGSGFDIMQAQVGKIPPDLRQFSPAIPEAVVAVLMRALEKERDLRFSTVAELHQALEVAAGAEVGAGVGEPAQEVASGIAETLLEQPPAPVPASEPALPATVVEQPPAPVPALTPAPAPSLPRPSWFVPVFIGGGVVILLIIALVLSWGDSSDGSSKEDSAGATGLASSTEQPPELVPEPEPVAAEPRPSPGAQSEPVERYNDSVAPYNEPAGPAGGGSGCPTLDRPWVVLALSVKVGSSGAVNKANRHRDKLIEAGYSQASTCDGRQFPNFRCCYWTVAVGSFASKADAAALSKAVKEAGFSAFAKNAFHGKRAQ